MGERQGGSGMAVADYRAGHVLWMPRGATWLNRDKSRPFVLATACKPGKYGTLVYGSTQATEFIMGAISLLIEPHRQGVNRNGIDERTLFYPGILVRVPHNQLPPHAGGLGLRIDALRSELRHALGIGRGSCLAPHSPAGSRRGRIVKLKPRLARAVRTPFAVILTEPWYSRTLRYHVVLPVLRSAGQEDSPELLRVERQPWMAVFARHTTSVVMPVPVVHSIWHRSAIAAETEHVLDEDTLARVDRELCRFFSLPEPDGKGAA